jgi:hypothetical protein
MKSILLAMAKMLCVIFLVATAIVWVPMVMIVSGAMKVVTYKTAFPLLLVCALACSGCVNLYTRFPTTDAKIESVYQSSRVAAMLATVGSFPQMMSDAGDADAFIWENLISVPFIGLPCAVDAACEACIDTVFLPYDLYVVKSKEDK